MVRSLLKVWQVALVPVVLVVLPLVPVDVVPVVAVVPDVVFAVDPGPAGAHVSRLAEQTISSLVPEFTHVQLNPDEVVLELPLLSVAPVLQRLIVGAEE